MEKRALCNDRSIDFTAFNFAHLSLNDMENDRKERSLDTRYTRANPIIL